MNHEKGVADSPNITPNGSAASAAVFDLLQSICAAVVFGILIYLFLFHVTGVRGTSMYSTLHEGDRLFTSNLFYEPEQGDIIILRTAYYSEPLVKRVIATEGQTIDIDFDTGDVTVDGIVLQEDYIYERTHFENGFEGPVTVPEGTVFVMGDNRNNSNDSRLPAIGFIDKRAILGRALFILIPGTEPDGRRDWSRFGTTFR